MAGDLGPSTVNGRTPPRKDIEGAFVRVVVEACSDVRPSRQGRALFWLVAAP